MRDEVPIAAPFTRRILNCAGSPAPMVDQKVAAYAAMSGPRGRARRLFGGSPAPRKTA